MSDTFEPYDYQTRVADVILSGQSVILQAPTGAGKTAAAILPFIHAIQYMPPNQFPRQCVYSVPMRVLANQLKAAYENLTRRAGLTDRLKVEIQTGEHPDDPKVEGDLVFTTIDQTLSNVLCVPYAVGGGSANINAGAVISSYLVFDEFHLFSPDDSMRTTLELLSLFSDTVPVTPFVLMTATFSTKMLGKLAQKLNAKVVTVSRDELAKIPSQQNKVRRYTVCEKPLDADAVWNRHRTRSIAICNTVERAQDLYEALVTKGCQPIPFDDPRLSSHYQAIQAAIKMQEQERAIKSAMETLYRIIDVNSTTPYIILLHARFTLAHRALKESLIRSEFGDKTRQAYKLKSLILVATQVIEVGLDITCENLHTEIAPANAVLQRAGRCARFKNECGDVFVYDVPLDKKGNRSFAPYHEKTERDLCEKAWTAFKNRSGNVLDFYGEQDVIDEVHTEADTRMLEELEESKGRTWEQIRHAMTQSDPSMRPDLIRDASDSCSLLVCKENDLERLGNPFGYRGFSFYRGSLRGKWKDLQEWAHTKDLKWIVQIPREKKQPEQDEDAKQSSKFDWLPIPPHFDDKDLPYSPLYVVNPALVAYDAQVGFRFSESGGVNPDDLLERAKGRQRDFDSKYQLEDYPAHIKKMMTLYRARPAERLVYAATQLEKRLGLPSGSIDRTVRLAIAFHDVGKMQVDWQKWARNYQEKIGETVTDENMMIAHTHSETEEHREKGKKVRPKRPYHAAEGAVATMNLAKMLVGENDALYKAVMTAVARHHSARTDPSDVDYRIHTAAPSAVAQALKEAGENVEPAIVVREFELNAPDINFDEERLGSGDKPEAWLIYLLAVRALRLADGESLEEK